MRIRQERPYSRVYWEALDDPKFATVWDDDRALAAWLRLLVAADMAWPASASLYHGVNRNAFQKLCDVGLVDVQIGGRYRIHGLDKERAARAESARAAANIRHHGTADGFPPHADADYDRNAPALRPHDSGNAEGMPSRDETRLDEQSRAKTSKSNTAPAFDVMLLVENLTRRPFNYREGHQVHDTLVGDVAAHGAAKVTDAYREFHRAASGPIDAAQLVFGVHKVLHPLPRAAAVDAARRESESEATWKKRVEATRMATADMREAMGYAAGD